MPSRGESTSNQHGSFLQSIHTARVPVNKTTAPRLTGRPNWVPTTEYQAVEYCGLEGRPANCMERHTPLLNNGDRVVLQDGRQGRIRWIGYIPKRSSVYVGIQLDEPLGEHDGIFQGKRYFRCRQDFGTIVDVSDVACFKRRGWLKFESCEIGAGVLPTPLKAALLSPLGINASELKAARRERVYERAKALLQHTDDVNIGGAPGPLVQTWSAEEINVDQMLLNLSPALKITRSRENMADPKENSWISRTPRDVPEPVNGVFGNHSYSNTASARREVTCTGINSLPEVNQYGTMVLTKAHLIPLALQRKHEKERAEERRVSLMGRGSSAPPAGSNQTLEKIESPAATVLLRGSTRSSSRETKTLPVRVDHLGRDLSDMQAPEWTKDLPKWNFSNVKCEQKSFHATSSKRSRKRASQFDVRVGDRVVMNTGLMGTCRWGPGPLDSKYITSTIYLGIQLDDPVGEHDGLVGGKRYFLCPEDCGLLRPINEVRMVKPRNAIHYRKIKFT